MKEKGRSPYCPMCPTARARSQPSLCAELPSHFCNREKKKKNYKEVELVFGAKLERRGERERERDHVCLVEQFLLPSYLHISFILLIL